MSDKLTLHKKLIDIQQNLKVPKEQSNEFGGFNFRSIEDIEDKVKPFLAKHDLTLTFEDDIIPVGDRVYVKSTAILCDGELEIKKSAFAREATTPRAKTDDAQLTGACSSYARKYAASALFLLDNTKDADSTSHQPTTKKEAVDDLSKIKKELFDQFKAHDMTDPETIKEYIREITGSEEITNIVNAKRVLSALKDKADQEDDLQSE